MKIEKKWATYTVLNGDPKKGNQKERRTSTYTKVRNASIIPVRRKLRIMLAAVAKLREALTVPETMAVPAAVREMNKMMGLNEVDVNGELMPLPRQVQALLEATGLEMQESTGCGDTTSEGAGSSSDPIDLSTKASQALSNLQQSTSPHAFAVHA